MTPSARCEKSKFFGFWEECGRKLKLERNDGGHHQEWSLRLNLIQHGKTPNPDIVRMDRLIALSVETPQCFKSLECAQNVFACCPFVVFPSSS